MYANCKSNHKPWLTPGLVNALYEKKNTLYKVFLKFRSNEAENKYNAYQNKLITIIRFCENNTMVTNWLNIK